jgi:signal transduction histidine kinase
VSVRVDSTVLMLTVCDDGSGPSGIHAGLGLGSMAARAAELGGTLTLTPVEPHGTKLYAVLPLGEP